MKNGNKFIYVLIGIIILLLVFFVITIVKPKEKNRNNDNKMSANNQTNNNENNQNIPNNQNNNNQVNENNTNNEINTNENNNSNNNSNNNNSNSNNNNNNGIKTLNSKVTATFLECYMAISLNDSDWQELIKEWKEMNIQYVVIGETAYKNNDGWYTYYPSSISGTKMYYNSVEKILQHCKEANMKVFVSCGNNPSPANLCKHDGYDGNGNKTQGQESFIQSINSTLPFIEEVYKLYYEKYKDIWYGWYFTPEISNNVDWETAQYFNTGVETLSKSLNITIDKIRGYNSNFKIMLSPYLNVEENASWCTRNTNVITNYWKEVINNTKFIEGDVLAPQDSCNNMQWDYNKLAKYTKCYRDAIDNANKKINLWMNLELTMGLDPNDEETKYVDKTQSTFVNRMIMQMATEEPYSDGFMTYSFCFYYSKTNVISGFYETYKNFLETGALENQKPTAPTQAKASTIKLDGREVLSISFSGMKDNYGIARAEIYKNGQFLTYRVSNRLETYYLNERIGIGEPNNFFDRSFNLSNDNANYEIYVYDCAGNKSDSSYKFNVRAQNGTLTVTGK